MTETFKLLMKSCAKFVCYSLIFNVLLHVHLKKLKFEVQTTVSVEPSQLLE